MVRPMSCCAQKVNDSVEERRKCVLRKLEEELVRSVWGEVDVLRSENPAIQLLFASNSPRNR